MLSVSIDRSSLSLSALVINDYPSGGMWLPEEGMSRPEVQPRNVYATSSPFVNGQTLVSMTLDQASLPFRVQIQGATTAARKTLEDSLRAALTQFSYTITVTEDGVATTWTCDPAAIAWSDVDSGMTAAHMSIATVTVPVYPVAS